LGIAGLSAGELNSQRPFSPGKYFCSVRILDNGQHLSIPDAMDSGALGVIADMVGLAFGHTRYTKCLD
jgi:hypothetical protein